eukprot:9983917-Lingulodinium_polyedra.AAC.1
MDCCASEVQQGRRRGWRSRLFGCRGGCQDGQMDPFQASASPRVGLGPPAAAWVHPTVRPWSCRPLPMSALAR